MELTGRTALVTGSSRNLGAEIARELASRGARVAVTYRRSEADARRLLAEMEESPAGPHLAFDVDLGESTAVRALCAGVEGAFGGVDILVNNAGPFSMDPFVELSEDDWDRIWDTNVKTAYLCTQHLAPGMRSRGWGRIVNVSAGSAYIRNHSIYTLAKRALITLTEELAVELGPEVTVNCVAPGQIAESAEDMMEFDPGFVERAIAATPLGRLVTRADVAVIVGELCGPRFDVVTGVTIPIDGGWHIPRF